MKKYWLIGGVWGAIISLTVGLLNTVFSFFNTLGEIGLGFVYTLVRWLYRIIYVIPLQIFGEWKYKFLNYCGYRSPEFCHPNIQTFLLDILLLFLIGTFIGLLYGKFKNRGKSRS